MSGQARKSSDRRMSEDDIDGLDSRPTKRQATDRESKKKTQQEAITTPSRTRRATSSESVSIYVPSPSPERDVRSHIDWPHPGRVPERSVPEAESSHDPADPSLRAQRSAVAIHSRGSSPASPYFPQEQGDQVGAPTATMASGGAQGSDVGLFIPMTERSASGELGSEDIASKDTVSAENWAKFKAIFKELSVHERTTSRLMQQMNTEHHNALERARKVASRRNRRIEQLERENAALKNQLTSKAAGASTSDQWEEQYNMSQQALQMLTEDCNDWETKYNKLQRELNSTIIQTSTTDRNSRFNQEQVEELTQQLDDCQNELNEARKGLKRGSLQLQGLQSILKRVDEIVIDPLRELANSGGSLYTESKNERLKKKVADQVTALVNAWNRFQSEYDEAIGHAD